MYTAFQELGTDRDRDYDEEKRVKDAVFTLLKSSGGRFMSYRNGKRPEEGLIIVDEKTARQSKCNVSLLCLSTLLALSFVNKSYSFYTCSCCAQKSLRILAEGWKGNIFGMAWTSLVTSVYHSKRKKQQWRKRRRRRKQALVATMTMVVTMRMTPTPHYLCRQVEMTSFYP